MWHLLHTNHNQLVIHQSDLSLLQYGVAAALTIGELDLGIVTEQHFKQLVTDQCEQ